LGRALTAGCLLATLSKLAEERLRIDFRSRVRDDDPPGGLLVDARGDGTVRGCLRRGFGDVPLRAALERTTGRLPLAPFLGRRGTLLVTRDFDAGNRYQGTVELVAGEVDLDLEHYLNTSEQLPSLLRCDVVLDPVGGVLRAGGILCQTFPGAGPEVLAPLRARLADDALAALLLQPREPAELVRFVLGGADFEDMGKSPLHYRCPCNISVARDILATLGADDLDALARERDSTEVRCSYCGERYHLTSADLHELAAELRWSRS
ncbi:MAG TPA: Hsp33 family molecular chaperone HslO, partial [Nannocystis sp.]